MAESTLQLVIVTPEMTLLDEPVDFVAAPLVDGEIGIAKGRAPMIGALGFGELRFRRAGENTRYFVEGGFLQVADNEVSVMTPGATLVSEIDVAEAHKQLEEALAMSTAPAESAAREREVTHARSKLRVLRAKSDR